MKYGTLIRIEDISMTEQQFKVLKDYGFTACQLVYKPKEYIKEDAELIHKYSNKYNIDISAQFCGYYDTNTVWDIYYGYNTAGINVPAYGGSRIEYVKSAIDFASWVGTEDIIIHAGFIPNNPFEREYSLMLANVEILAAKCASLDMNLLFETGAEAPITLLRLIEDIGRNNLFINFDPANILMYGYGNPADALRIFAKYVRNVHGKDGLLPDSTRNIGKEMPAGEGLVDFPEVVRLLKEVGYDRYIIIEREISGEQQTKDILMAAKYFKRIWDMEL